MYFHYAATIKTLMELTKGNIMPTHIYMPSETFEDFKKKMKDQMNYTQSEPHFKEWRLHGALVQEDKTMNAFYIKFETSTHLDDARHNGIFKLIPEHFERIN